MASDCGVCHTTTTWLSTAGFDHNSVAGTACVICHDGQNSTGKPPTHIVSSDTCDDCHNTNSWLAIPAVFDHTGITTECIACHDGIRATGKGPAHRFQSDSCGDCHTVLSWRIPVNGSQAP